VILGEILVLQKIVIPAVRREGGMREMIQTADSEKLTTCLPHGKRELES
jgi:hypothetical protein